MKRFSVIAAAVLATATLLGTTGCAVTSGQSSVGQYVDDSTITARVKTKMATDPTVSAMRIEVKTVNGTVQLAGFATSQAEKDAAGKMAAEVPDVKSVRNDIIVRAPSN